MKDVLDGAKASVQRYHGILDKIFADPTLTPENGKVLAATAAERTLSPLFEKFDAVNARLNKARDEAERRISDSLSAGRGPGDYAGEIRAAIRDASARDRNKILSDALETGNARVIGAVIASSSEPFMTGLGTAEMGHLEARWVQSQLPEEAGRTEAIERARGALRRGGEALAAVYLPAIARAKDASEKMAARKEALSA